MSSSGEVGRDRPGDGSFGENERMVHVAKGNVALGEPGSESRPVHHFESDAISSKSVSGTGN
jgi:hypothetical protein